MKDFYSLCAKKSDVAANKDWHISGNILRQPIVQGQSDRYQEDCRQVTIAFKNMDFAYPMTNGHT